MPLEYQASITKWFGPHSLTVADGVSEQAIVPLGTGGLTTITFVQITSDVAVSVTYGTANVNVPVSLAAGGMHTLAGTSLTAIAISNGSGSTANVRYLAGGS
jgi:hypothetical protein